jgi:nucleoside-diphosphate-sugar epimerase
MEPKGMTVAITGAAGYLAGRLIEALESEDRVERILGFDVREPNVTSSKLVFDQVDVRNAHLEERFRGADVVVHLAFVMDPIRDEATMRDVNVNGSQNVFRCAGQAGVGKIVYTSSATAYGAHPNNDLPLTEESPLRANLDFNYPAHKLEVEYVVREFREEFTDVRFVMFRPAIVFGPHVDNAWSRMLQAPVFFAIKDSSPTFQFVHEDDVARALAFAITEDLDGNYNVAAEGWLSLDEALEISGKKRRSIGEAAAFTMSDRMWRWGLGEAPAGLLHYVMHPWAVSTEKLARAGFKAEHSNEEILRATAEAGKDFVTMGRARVNRKGLRTGAAAGLGALGLGALLKARRRKKRART